MITIEVSGKRKEVDAAAKQITTLLLTSGKVVKSFDASVNHGAWNGATNCDVILIKRPE